MPADSQRRTRVVQIQQNNHYYSFGMPMYGEWSELNYSANDYKYNGKEEQSELGLGLMDYENRFYDPALGRFTAIDPSSA